MQDVVVDPMQLVQAMGHGMAVVDLLGNVTWANDAADRITGFRRPSERTDWSPHVEWCAVRPDGSPLPPHERPAVIAMRTGQPVHNQLVGFEAPGDGTTHWMQASAVPHCDEAGHITGAIVTFEDVSVVRAVTRHLDDQHRAGRPGPGAGREALLALEEAVLPRALPDLAGVDLAAHYLPAVSATSLGGDWYDALPLPDGQVLLSIGDVAGHGLEAVGLMNVLHHAIRLFAALDPDPATIITGLRRLIARHHAEEFATVALALLDPTSGRVRCVTAGHLPPVIRRAGGQVEPLMARASGPALGARSLVVDVPTDAVLAPGDALVLFTDGLIERRREALDLGYERLALHLERAEASAAGIAGAAIHQLRHAADNDDVCVLVVQRTADAPCAVAAPQEATGPVAGDRPEQRPAGVPSHAQHRRHHHRGAGHDRRSLGRRPTLSDRTWIGTPRSRAPRRATPRGSPPSGHG